MGVLRGDTVYDSEYQNGIPVTLWRDGVYTVPANCSGPQVTFDEAEAGGWEWCLSTITSKGCGSVPSGSSNGIA